MANEAVELLRAAYETLVAHTKSQLERATALANHAADVVAKTGGDVSAHGPYLARCVKLERTLVFVLDDTRKRAARALAKFRSQHEAVEELFISDDPTNEYIRRCCDDPTLFRDLPDILAGEPVVDDVMVTFGELFGAKPGVGKS